MHEENVEVSPGFILALSSKTKSQPHPAFAVINSERLVQLGQGLMLIHHFAQQMEADLEMHQTKGHVLPARFQYLSFQEETRMKTGPHVDTLLVAPMAWAGHG